MEETKNSHRETRLLNTLSILLKNLCMQSGDLDIVLKKNLGKYRLMHSHFCQLLSEIATGYD